MCAQDVTVNNTYKFEVDFWTLFHLLRPTVHIRLMSLQHGPLREEGTPHFLWQSGTAQRQQIGVSNL